MSVHDTMPAPPLAPADRPTDPGNPPDPVAGQVVDFGDKVFTQLALMEKKQDAWGAQILEQVKAMVLSTQQMARQFDLVSEELVSLRVNFNQLNAKVRRLEARVELLEASHGQSGANGAAPTEQ